MSKSVSQRYKQQLPFLFKVLSVNKSLSIQAHPNKKLAEQLHAKDPEHYPDDNHKPEMTIAITPFEAMCGFRPLAEIAHFLRSVSSLRELVGEEAASEFESQIKQSDDTEKNKKVLRAAFTAVMKTKSEDLERLGPKLVQQAKDEGSNFANGGVEGISGQELSDLIVRLNGQFPNDIGLFVTFFLNYVKLEVGEAMFLKADDIHAYLAGDVMECMASSNNVVRAGFTPKYKDVSTLSSMLTYSYAPIEEQKLQTTDYAYAKLNAAAFQSNSNCTLYDPPIEEFSVLRTVLGSHGSKITYEPIQGPSIVICTQGKGTISVGPKVEEMKEGYVYFVGATAELVVESKGDEPFVSFKAFCELEEAVTNGNSQGHL